MSLGLLTMEEIALAVHVREIGQAALLIMEIGVQASSILAGFRFVFWASNRAKRVKGK